jgi:hypothetical protein
MGGRKDSEIAGEVATGEFARDFAGLGTGFFE